jgi:hypothetical protein
MLIITLLMSVLLPFQVHPGNTSNVTPEYRWAAKAVMDATRIITMSNHKQKLQVLINPELLLRDSNPDDKPIPKRRQFIQDYVNQSGSKRLN